MKKLITALALFSAFSSFGVVPVTCLDSRNWSNRVNSMVIYEGQNFELISLTIGGVSYLPRTANSVRCQAGVGPMGGIQNSREITCNLPNGLQASIHYVIDGRGTATIFRSNRNLQQVDQFSQFGCMVIYAY